MAEFPNSNLDSSSHPVSEEALDVVDSSLMSAAAILSAQIDYHGGIFEHYDYLRGELDLQLLDTIEDIAVLAYPSDEGRGTSEQAEAVQYGLTIGFGMAEHRWALSTHFARNIQAELDRLKSHLFDEDPDRRSATLRQLLASPEDRAVEQLFAVLPENIFDPYNEDTCPLMANFNNELYLLSLGYACAAMAEDLLTQTIKEAQHPDSDAQAEILIAAREIVRSIYLEEGDIDKY